MRRRTFIILTFTMGESMKGLIIPNANTSENEEPFTVPELELVGKKRPQLYGEGFNLRKKAAQAFDAMRSAAHKDGIKIYSLSSYRSFDRQMSIWNRKYLSPNLKNMTPEERVRDILTYSSLPGSSRHHWGTDADLIDLNHPRPSDPLLASHFEKGGIYYDLYFWLIKHAHQFGFYEAYTNDPERTGYNYEPWHWSYAPLSIPLLKQFDSLDLGKHLHQSQIEGKTAFTPKFIEEFKEKWGRGINPKLIPTPPKPNG